MLARHAFFPALLILPLLSSMARPTQRGQSGAREIDSRDVTYCLDIVIQSGNPGRVGENLQRQGLELIGGLVERAGASTVTHLFAGRFSSVTAAARSGDSLVARGIIDQFAVRPIPDPSAITRPRTVMVATPPKRSFESTSASLTVHPFLPRSDGRTTTIWEAANRRPVDDLPTASIGQRRTAMLVLAPGLDANLGPRVDAVKAALRLLAPGESVGAGGLWVGGDIAAALSRLEWIAGYQNASVLTVASDGKIKLDTVALLRASRATTVRAGADLVVADYIRSNEGLYLLAQLTAASNRYCFYVGQRMPTAGLDVPVIGSINLDGNFDRRINPYRKDGVKVPRERPPAEFDDIVGINPTALWFNIKARRLVPDGMIAFHELAEALAKIDYGLEYLPAGLQPGAHDVAMQRELKLSSQRSREGAITTTGSNRVFGSEKSFLEFEAETRGGR